MKTLHENVAHKCLSHASSAVTSEGSSFAEEKTSQKWPIAPIEPEPDPLLKPLLEAEDFARKTAESRRPVLFLSNTSSALVVFGTCIFTYESMLSVCLSVAMTCYVYFVHVQDTTLTFSMDWVLLGFAVVTPMSISIGLAFKRRENALRNIALFRSCAFQVFLAHASWDWGNVCDSGRLKATDKQGYDWQDHADQCLAELIGMADELCSFLTLPSFSRARHRVTPWGRQEASRTVEVAYRLWDSLLTVRMSKLSYMTEKLKQYGMPGNESSRIRQWERMIGEAVEQLRILKTYRTPQALRSFARLFTIVLPAFYSPDFAQLARDSNSLGFGLTFAVLTSFALSALYEAIYMLEDPFVAHISLDGIDVHEELRVLHWHQLVNARQLYFPKAPAYNDKFSFDFSPQPQKPASSVGFKPAANSLPQRNNMTRESSYNQFRQSVSVREKPNSQIDPNENA